MFCFLLTVRAFNHIQNMQFFLSVRRTVAMHFFDKSSLQTQLLYLLLKKNILFEGFEAFLDSIEAFVKD